MEEKKSFTVKYNNNKQSYGNVIITNWIPD